MHFIGPALALVFTNLARLGTEIEHTVAYKHYRNSVGALLVVTAVSFLFPLGPSSSAGRGLYGRLDYQVVEYFIPNDLHHLKALSASNIINQHVAVNANKMLAVEDRVFILESRESKQKISTSRWIPYLTSGINNLKAVISSLVSHNLRKCVLNCRVIRLNKMALDKLNGE
jgi:hypothetical protein